MTNPSDRKTILLRAAYDLLTKSERSGYVVEAAGILVRYDEADCDGMCLRQDIADELNIGAETDPIPVMEKEED